MAKNKKKDKKSLGRGLSALLQSEDYSEKDNLASNEAVEEMKYQLIDINKITSNPDQPRSIFDQEKLAELSQSIKSVGIIEPILLRKNPDDSSKQEYQIIAGERRWRAAQMAGIEKVPAIIKDHNNDNLLETMLIENLQREDLTALEEAQSYESILNKKKITQEQLADILGKSRSHITNMIRVSKAPLKVRKLLAENKLTMSQVRAILSKEPEEMERLALEAVENQLSVRELEKRVSSRVVTPKTKNEKTVKDPNILEIEELYRQKLKTKVTISMIKNNVGKLEIDYYHYDELLGILNRIKDSTLD